MIDIVASWLNLVIEIVNVMVANVVIDPCGGWIRLRRDDLIDTEYLNQQAARLTLFGRLITMDNTQILTMPATQSGHL